MNGDYGYLKKFGHVELVKAICARGGAVLGDRDKVQKVQRCVREVWVPIYRLVLRISLFIE